MVLKYHLLAVEPSWFCSTFRGPQFPHRKTGGLDKINNLKKSHCQWVEPDQDSQYSQGSTEETSPYPHRKPSKSGSHFFKVPQAILTAARVENAWT